ncbi:CHRD domain-containing protein [Paenibacillus arenilitoris]|uniref:CHRD domain-containing protein n=1 Tax=Paenibacillus arenilitoris TaxID=2772299 RepID=A0A927CRX9_9BACL|nr:CHRD domain-containing protein [Paenibacillus arenilitoris]MBD2870806.1 CHRD domain-containing protein [Paenibacillus arenilitoris]
MRKFTAILRGKNEVPPVRTNATGSTLFQLNRAGDALFFKLTVRDIRRVTAAHIHLGPKGVNGPVVAFLFGDSPFGITVRKGVVTGRLTAANLMGPLSGRTIADLVREIKNNNAYVNVHTEQNPNGEIRGQIFKNPC